MYSLCLDFDNTLRRSLIHKENILWDHLDEARLHMYIHLLWDSKFVHMMLVNTFSNKINWFEFEPCKLDRLIDKQIY